MSQLSLFAGSVVEAAVADDASALSLPERVRFGTSSWSFPGWEGLVYKRRHDEKTLAREGLSAYARHPLLRAVGVDRTHYGPVDERQFAEWADAVPEGFRFLVKAHEELTLTSFPSHARYGERRGAKNPRFLDAAYARDVVVGPSAAGLGPKLGVLLFQLAPQSAPLLGGAQGFAERLHRFLSALPAGVPYAVEVRTPSLLTPAYRDALLDVGASHCLNAISGMPSLREQVQLVEQAVGPRLVVRWLLRGPLSYEQAKERYAPFTRLVDEDPEVRRDLVDIVARALERDLDSIVIVNNKAEGCAPLTIRRAAEELCARVCTT